MLKRVLILAAVLLAAIPSFATSYYTAKLCSGGAAAPNCTDANNGTSVATAKLTIQAGANLLSPGDTLFIRGNGTGIYVESFVDSIPAGTAGNYVTLANYNGETVRIRPSSGSWVFNFGSSHGSATQYIQLSGLIIDGVNLDSHTPGELQPLGDGIKVDCGATCASIAHDIRVYQCLITNNPGAGMLVFGTGTQVVNSELTNNATSGNPGPGIEPLHDIYWATASGLIDGNYIHDSGAPGPDPDHTQGIQIYNGGSGLNNNIVRNNIIGNHPFGAGIVCCSGGTGNLIYNNVFYADDGIALAFNQSGTGVYNNTIYNSIGNAITINCAAGSCGTKVQNNIFWGNGTNGVGSCAGCTPDGTITNNHNSTTNPNFVNPAGVPPNLQLQATSSAALDLGLDLSSALSCTAGSTCTDKLGVPRPQGSAWDLGAYEFTGGGGGGGSGNTRTQVITESFTGGAAALTAPDWAQGLTSPTVNKDGSGNATGSAIGNAFAKQISATFTNLQYASMTYKSRGTNTGGFSGIGVTCLSSGANATYNAYSLLVYNDGNADLLYLTRMVNGSDPGKIFEVAGAWANGDEIAIECNGSTGEIWAFHNSNVVIHYTDGSPLTTGVPGIFASGDATGDNWIGGNINFTGATFVKFTTQPASPVASGATFSTDPVAAVKLADGTTTDTSSTASIVIALCAGSPAGTLGGTLTRSAVSGVATFTGLSITQSMGGVGYTLCITSAGLTGDTSTAITVTGDAPMASVTRARVRARFR